MLLFSYEFALAKHRQTLARGDIQTVEHSRALVAFREVCGSNPVQADSFSGTKFANFAEWFVQMDLSSSHLAKNLFLIAVSNP